MSVGQMDRQFIYSKSIGVDLVIMSTEINGVVTRRAEKLKVECIQSVINKKECLKQYCSEKNIELNDVAYVGMI